MLQEEIGKQIMQFMRKNFLFDEKKTLGENESLIASGVIDSTGILELISFLEQNFNLKFEDHELVAENFDSIEQIKKFISKKTGN